MVALKPENIEDFARVFAKGKKIQGKKFSSYRKAGVSRQGSFVLTAVERRGYNGFVVQEKPSDIAGYKNALKAFSSRKRFFGTDVKGMLFTEKLVEKQLKKLGKARVADAFFRAERVYWQKRNNAGKVQKARQDKLGLGWGNHDHHTYRSSRQNFSRLIKIFEEMGFVCREAFHAGKAAGWGAQIMEHPDCNVVVFADLDLSVKEKKADFVHRKLKPSRKLGTVGLWVGLHGESILQAGMHHLECRFDFEKLRRELPKHSIKVMAPFSYFGFLKQAFTEGTIWIVDESRARKLLEKGSITNAQYERFVKQGAIGSHLENLQRAQGFKGFNQDSVTAIIKAIDPRKQAHVGRVGA